MSIAATACLQQWLVSCSLCRNGWLSHAYSCCACSGSTRPVRLCFTNHSLFSLLLSLFLFSFPICRIPSRIQMSVLSSLLLTFNPRASMVSASGSDQDSAGRAIASIFGNQLSLTVFFVSQEAYNINTYHK
jgi:hypothetical protein